MRAEQIAIQTYTVRGEIDRDVIGTLHRLAAMGYRAVEFAGIGDAMPPGLPDPLGVGQWARVGSGALTPADVRATLDETGMRAASIHIGFPPEETLGLVADYAHTLGAEYAVLAWAPEERRRTVEDVKRLAAYFNALAEKLRAHGIKFAYHNHDFEFVPIDGTDFYRIITSETDPALVNLELDVYWAAYAGLAPGDLIHGLAGRLPLLHIKDMAHGEGREWETVGVGVLNWPEIIAAARTAGTEWYVVEHDAPADPMQVAESGLRYLQTLAQ